MITNVGIPYGSRGLKYVGFAHCGAWHQSTIVAEALKPISEFQPASP